MLLVVFLLYFRRRVHVEVEDRIARMTEDVQRQKVEVQTDDTAPVKVQYDLRIERDRPGDEVDPADDLNEDVHHPTTRDIDEQEVGQRGDVHLWRLRRDDDVTLVSTSDADHASEIVVRLIGERDARNGIDVTLRIVRFAIVQERHEHRKRHV